jgi:hypothetical protein
MDAKAARKKAISDTQCELRAKLWPSVTEDDLWNRKKRSGFTTIPRTMPLFAEIMDSMSSGKPVSKVYLDLWCRAFDEHVVVLSKKVEMAFNSGFGSQRGVQTWSSRLDILADLGFVKVASGSNGPRSYALILNPYKIVAKHWALKTSGLTEAHYNALIARAIEIKADDI